MRWFLVLLFFGVAACGPSPQSLTTSAPPETFTPCTDCSNRRIASHGIIFPGMDFATKDSLAAAASASHAGMIRMDLTWAVAQPSPPPAPYDWRLIDESVRAAKKNHLEILALIAETPAWASSNPSSPAARSYPPQPQYFDEWKKFITAFVDRYGIKGTNEIRHWEIWGEANDNGQWLGSPADFAHLYSVAYDAIKTSDPNAQVLMAGLNESKMPDWLNSVLNDSSFPAKGKIDIIDVHIRGSFDHVKNLAAGAKEVFRLQGVENKPIWITEFGFPSAPAFQSQPNWDPHFAGTDEVTGEQGQANYYNAVIPWLLTDGGIEKVFVTLRDLDAPGTPWESEGVVTLGGRSKTAFKALRDLSDRLR